MAKTTTCLAEGCQRDTVGRGMCKTHYARFMRNGTLDYQQEPFGRENDTATEKQCARCLEVLPRTEFHKQKRSKDGLRGWCKPCTRASNTSSYESNKDRARAWQIEYLSRPEVREARTEMLRAYYAKNRDVYAKRAHVRRALIADALVDEGVTIQALRERHGDSCVFCGRGLLFEGGRDYDPRRASMEHMVPLSRGGEHSWANIRLSCWECNLSKNDKTPDEYVAFLNREGRRCVYESDLDASRNGPQDRVAAATN